MQDPLIGQQIDTYVIRGLLGSGGMAQVYRADEPHLSREVALKLLAAHIQQQPGFATRFLQEGRVLASFQHPGIVHVYNVGEYQGRPYLVQELLPGPTLEEELRAAQAQGQTLPAAAVVGIISEVSSALDYAHQRGIIHRDLKPSNLMRNVHGQMVLMDFGIAKTIAGSQKLTQTGMVLGTPQYLAPEQARGGALTPAVDIYALGVIIFEMTTGRVPFDDPSALSVAIAHLSSPPPAPRSLRSDLPPAVEAVILRALAKEPNDRFPSAGALAHALADAWQASAIPIHQRPTTVAPVPAAAHEDARARAGAANARTAINPPLMQQAQQARESVPPPQPAAPPLPAATPPLLRPPARRGQTARRGMAVAGLALALLGAFLVLRPKGSPTDETPTPTVAAAAGQPTVTAAIATLLPTEAAAVVPTTPPADLPTETIIPTNPPVAVPTAAPATGSPADQFRSVLATAVANGQADAATASDLAEKLATLEATVADSTSKDNAVSKAVKDLEKEIDEAERDGTLDSGVAADLRGLLTQVATD
ncbi:MAG TPA: protein kinase [Herpetosiphonaceae bacterium]|nr:protein kinase [Herpetosiphonaceae bacterium]